LLTSTSSTFSVEKQSRAIQKLKHDHNMLLLEDVISLYQMVAPSNIKVSENGIFQINKDSTKQLVCNTLFVPIMQIKDEFLNNTKNSIAVKGFLVDKQLPLEIITHSEFFKGTWIQDKWGFEVMLGKKKSQSIKLITELVHKIVQYCDIFQRYNYIGWKNSLTSTFYANSRVYVTANKIIGFNSKQLKTIPNSELSKFSLSTNNCSIKDNYKFVVDKMLQVAPPEITYTALAFQLLSLTTTLLINNPYKPSFIYYLHGRSGSRKTTLAKLFFNVFEGFKEIVPINFTATISAIEQLMLNFRDTTLLIDDIAPAVTKHDANEQKRKLEGIIRTYGDNVGRKKNSRLDFTPQGFCAITAETNIIDNKSSYVRSYIVELESESVNLELLSFIQENKDSYSSFISEYIADISPLYMSQLVHNFKNNKKLFQDMGSYEVAHGRSVEIAAWLLSSFQQFLLFGHKNRILIPQINLLENMKRVLHKWIIQTSNTSSYITNVIRFRNAVNELIASSQYAFVKLFRKDKKQSYKPVNTKIIGYKDEQYLYFLPDILCKALTSFYNGTDTPFNISKKQLIHELDEYGYIVSDNNIDNTKTVRININGSRVSVLRIEKKHFYTDIL